jgi:dCMP deaminase
MKRYKILQKYQNPCLTIHPPVIKTAKEWLELFPMLEERDLDIKTDWFELVEGEKPSPTPVISKVDWDQRFIDLAEYVGQWSKDRSTKVGAIIVDDDNRIVTTGYNGFPTGCNDDVEERHERPLKYAWTEHGERNAIYSAARRILEGCTMYLKWFPCSDCARGIVQSGIKKLVCCEPDFDTPKWGEDFKISLEILTEGGVEIHYEC